MTSKIVLLNYEATVGHGEAHIEGSVFAASLPCLIYKGGKFTFCSEGTHLLTVR